MTMDLTPQDSQEHARLLNEFVQAQERYKALLPRVVPVGAGGPPPALMTEEQLRLVQQADMERLLARESLYRFRDAHGIP